MLSQIQILASEETVYARDIILPEPSEIYAKFNKAYNTQQGMCDTGAIPLSTPSFGSGCTVSFDCRSNDDHISILQLLQDSLPAFAKEPAYKEYHEPMDFACLPGPPPCIPDPTLYLFRSTPHITSLSAKSVPPEGSGRFGAEVAHIRTTIECPQTHGDGDICGALGGLFALGTGVPNPLIAGGSAVGGYLIQTGCGVPDGS
jgi:hypothetical protein